MALLFPDWPIPPGSKRALGLKRETERSTQTRFILFAENIKYTSNIKYQDKYQVGRPCLHDINFRFADKVLNRPRREFQDMCKWSIIEQYY